MSRCCIALTGDLIVWQQSKFSFHCFATQDERHHPVGQPDFGSFQLIEDFISVFACL